MIQAQQWTGTIPITGQQAPLVPFQSGTVPAATASQFDLNSIMNLMLIMVMMILGRA